MTGGPTILWVVVATGEGRLIYSPARKLNPCWQRGRGRVSGHTFLHDLAERAGRYGPEGLPPVWEAPFHARRGQATGSRCLILLSTVDHPDGRLALPSMDAQDIGAESDASAQCNQVRERGMS